MCVERIPSMLRDLEAHEGPKKYILASYIIDPVKVLREDFSKFSEMIQTTLDLDMAEKGEFVVQPDIDENFYRTLFYIITSLHIMYSYLVFSIFVNCQKSVVILFLFNNDS